MYVDGLRLIDGQIENAYIEKGATLPVDNLRLGRLFYITDDDGGTPTVDERGLYVYTHGGWVNLNNSQNTVAVDDALAAAEETNNTYSTQSFAYIFNTANFTAIPRKRYHVTTSGSQIVVSIAASSFAQGQWFECVNGNTSDNTVGISSSNYTIVGETENVSGGNLLELVAGERVFLLCTDVNTIQVIKP